MGLGRRGLTGYETPRVKGEGRREKGQAAKRGAGVPAPRGRRSERALVVLFVFEIVHVLEFLVSLVRDATDILPDAAVADALLGRVARALVPGNGVLLVRAIAIVGHGLSFFFPPKSVT